MATLDIDAYFDKVYNTIKTHEEATAKIKIDRLNAQIEQVQKELVEQIAEAFSDRLELLITSDVISREDAVKLAKKYKIEVAKAPKSSSTKPTDPCARSSGGGIRPC